jgi:Immunity protein 35
MLSKDDARHRFVTDLNDEGVVVLDEHTVKRGWGWAFCYQPKRFVETRDWRNGLIENAPYLVNRANGEFGPSGTSQTVSKLIEKYEQRLGL